MMPRRDFNVKKRIREEEEDIDIALKAAGLYEQGISLVEKRSLLKCIAESKSSAQEEEENRRKFLNVMESSFLDEDISEVTDAQTDDPIITYESPSNFQNRKQICSRGNNNKQVYNNSCDSSTKEIAHSSSNSKNEKISTETTEVLICAKSKLPPPSEKKTIVKSMLSESFIEINSSPDQRKSPSSTKEDFIVSESEDETTDPIIIDNGDDKPTNKGITEMNTKISNDCDDIEEVFRKSEKKDTSITPIDKMKVDHKDNSSILSTVDVNKPCSEVLKEDNVKGMFSSAKKTESRTIEQKLNYISLDSPSKCPEESSSMITRKTESEAPQESLSEDLVLTTRNGSHAYGKRGLVNEKPSLSYFKSPYETDSKCIKRICSLITEWQSAFAKQQRSLTYPCKWGPPICVNRKVEGLVKNLSCRLVRKFVPETVYDSDISESEYNISDKSSGDEFEIFPIKKKSNIKSKKINFRNRGSRTKGMYNNTVDDNKLDGDTSKNEEKPQEVTPSVGPSTASNDLSNELSVDGQKESFSSEGSWLDTLSKPVNNNNKNNYKKHNQNHTFTKKSVRKTFQLTQEEEDNDSIDIEESNSEVLVESKSVTLGETSRNFRRNITEDSSEYVSVIKNTEQPNDVESNKRVSIKRKGEYDSLSMPPHKKSTSEINIDSCDESLSESTSKKDLENREALNLRLSIESQENTSNAPQNEISGKETTNGKVKVSEDSVKSTEDENKDEKMDTESDNNDIECPLCQIKFSMEEIEAHASECDGPIEVSQVKQHNLPSTSAGTSSSGSKGQIS